MLNPVSSPSAVNSPVPDAGVNLDKLPSAQTSDGKGRIQGDTRLAFTGVEEGVAAGTLIVWGAVVIGGAYLTYQAVAKDEYGKTGLQRQGEVISDAAHQIWDGLNNTAGRLGQAVPSLDSIKQNITEAFRAADRAGGNVNKMAEGLMRRILGNGAPVATPVAPNYPTAPATPRRSNPAARPPVAPARPNAAAAQQASQQAAAQAATQTFGKVQGSVDRMNDGVVSYYNDLAAGGTGKAGLQQVKQARRAVLSEFAALKKQVAASPSDLKSSSQATLTGVENALKANYNWIVGAAAHRPGTAPPQVPTTVASGTPSRGTGKDIANRVSNAAQNAKNRTAAAPQNRKNSATQSTPSPSAGSTNAAGAQQAREATALQTAQADAHRTTSTAFKASEGAIKTVNDGVLSFYNAASGGRAARANGAFATPLKTVQSGITELNGVVNTLKAEASKCSPADQATVQREVKRLTDLVGSTQTWLANAQAFSAGLSGPGGKHVAAPAVPQPPALLSDPKRTQKGVDALRTRVNKAATAAAAKNPTVAAANGRPVAPGTAQGAEGVKNPSGLPPPSSGITFVDGMPPNVTRQMPVWVNTQTGAVSVKAQSGSGWVRGALGIDETPPGGLSQTPPTGGSSGKAEEPQGNAFFDLRDSTFNNYTSSGGGGDQDPKGGKFAKAAQIAVGLSLIVGSVYGVAGYYDGKGSKNDADADRVGNATSDNTALAPPAPLNRADLLTPASKATQIVKVWDGYIAQISERLDANPVASPAFKAEFKTAADDFKVNLQATVARLSSKDVSAEEANALVQTLARPFPPMTLGVNPPVGASPAEVAKYRNLNVTLTGLINSMNFGVADTVARQIDTVKVSQPTPPSAPTVGNPAKPSTAAAPTAKPRIDPAAGQLKKAVDVLTAPETPKNSGSVAPVTPLTPPAAISQPKPVAPSAPKPSPVAKPAIPRTAQKTAPPSPTAAIANIEAAIAQAGLTNPPARAVNLKDIKFTPAMFLEQSQRGDLKATVAARDKAKALYEVIAEVANQNNKTEANRGIAVGIVQGPLASLRAVMVDLNKQIMDATAKPAVQPDDVPSASPSATPIDPAGGMTTPPSPMPSPSSTLVPEPATP